MFRYVFPIVMIILSNVLYNIFTKETPESANPFASLLVTYLTAAAVTGILLVTEGNGSGLGMKFKGLNWTCIALGISIVGLELGYIKAYRAGWNISIGSLVANICLAVILIFVGFLFYHEHISWNQLVGIGLCLAGLVFINLPK